jgi:hypothetical protein
MIAYTKATQRSSISTAVRLTAVLCNSCRLEHTVLTLPMLPMLSTAYQQDSTEHIARADCSTQRRKTTA